ncbi:MAG: cytochrome b N-terminal domain-containing protein [Alphaproteobacteria bacterium]|nr:cytochrome b N-terminal domain-containing protein [Alphaproteobacteria bacterium]
MSYLKRVLRMAFAWLEAGLDRIFTPACNPLYHLGALGFLYYWVVAATGIYLYIFFDTGLTEAHDSIESITYGQWYLGGVMRSLHRYASDGMVAMMMVHMLREFSLDRYRGARWFTWFTGLPVLWMVYAAGISGYWMVWDRLAQYIAIATTEWLDWLPIIGGTIARNFLNPERLDDRFFTLMVFMHIFVPLFLLFVLWIHLQRVTRPVIHPPRLLAGGTLLMLLVLSVIKPAESQPPANLDLVPSQVGLDWFYLPAYPLMDILGNGALWGLTALGTLLFIALPWLPPLRRTAAKAAVVDLANCNGCARCAEDCPYAAIEMGRRTDGRPFDRQAVVSTELCVACGICVGACPTAMPFRRASDLIPGIDLPETPARALRDRIHEAAEGLTGDARIMVFGCEHSYDAPTLAGREIAALRIPCVGMLPPAFIDYVLSRRLAEGVVLAGCSEGECHNRTGIRWTVDRLARTRDPMLRKRVPRERIETVWAPPVEGWTLRRRVAAFAEQLRRRAAEETDDRPGEAAE